MNVGHYIKTLRTKYGYSQEELGKMIGVQRAAVQKWECGKVQNLKRETIKKLAGIFNVPASSFIVVGEEKTTSPEQNMSEDERLLLELFRSVPAEHRRLVLDMIRTALKNQ